ncbi:hypothetical protein [Vibrio crassostreae]|uniref:hypothetical protein n=1 Tax=Vibrio crassostreae TaxID=246167 RepID=UPI001051B26D|nr:hypothetical protein [Vibrio crassostreae]TCW20219.1 hypothetical protein EDB48_104165 [Vibrio crassostreae]CAK3843908.1 hypothetical protein VCRA217O17_20289 [Vibrio crassostreae]
MTLSSVILFCCTLMTPLIILYISLYYEKRNAEKVISYYNHLLKTRLRGEELSSVIIMELDPVNRIKFTLSVIKYIPFLPFANLMKHLKTSLEKSEVFVKKCNENDGFIYETSAQDLISQRAACLQFYFMAELLTCNSIRYRIIYKKWSEDSSYYWEYWTKKIPDLVIVKRSKA